MLRKPGGDGDRMETWVDFSLFDDIKTLDGLEQRVLDTVKGVGLYEDVIAIGMRSKLKPGDVPITDADQATIVQARFKLRQEITRPGDESVEFYREDRFLEFCTIFENLVYCPAAAITEQYGSLGPFWKKHLRSVLQGKGLDRSLFQVGLKLARTDALLLEKLHKDKSPLLATLELDQGQIESRRTINERLGPGGDAFAKVEKDDPSLLEDIIELAFSHCPGRSKEHVLDDQVKSWILDLRHEIKSLLAEKSIGDIDFFNYDAYNPSLSIRENIVFGNVDPSRKKVNEEIDVLIQRLVKEAGLESLAVQRGLAYNVGERGAKLSGG